MKLRIARKATGEICRAGDHYVQFKGNVADALADAGQTLGIFTNQKSEPNALLVFFSATGVRAVSIIAHD